MTDVMRSGARVRWGNERFARITELRSVEDAQAFADRLLRDYRANERRGIRVRVEVLDGEAWRVLSDRQST